MKIQFALVVATLSMAAHAAPLYEAPIAPERSDVSDKVEAIDLEWNEQNITNGGNQYLIMRRLKSDDPAGTPLNLQDLRNYMTYSLAANVHDMTRDDIDMRAVGVRTVARPAVEMGDLRFMGQVQALAMAASTHEDSIVQYGAQLASVVTEMGLNSENAVFAKACAKLESENGRPVQVLQVLLMNVETREMISLYAAEGYMGDDETVVPDLCAAP